MTIIFCINIDSLQKSYGINYQQNYLLFMNKIMVAKFIQVFTVALICVIFINIIICVVYINIVI